MVDDSVQGNESVDALRKLNKKIHVDNRVHCSFLKVGDGTNIVFKK